ncbi:MAG: PEGA domain-containing protein [Deltaproteobacteria bacterium]|nr:PEGA domain-containing protein [Deltaproteobacteria bacterium]
MSDAPEPKVEAPSGASPEPNPIEGAESRASTTSVSPVGAEPADPLVEGTATPVEAAPGEGLEPAPAAKEARADPVAPPELDPSSISAGVLSTSGVVVAVASEPTGIAVPDPVAAEAAEIRGAAASEATAVAAAGPVVPTPPAVTVPESMDTGAGASVDLLASGLVETVGAGVILAVGPELPGLDPGPVSGPTEAAGTAAVVSAELSSTPASEPSASPVTEPLAAEAAPAASTAPIDATPAEASAVDARSGTVEAVASAPIDATPAESSAVDARSGTVEAVASAPAVASLEVAEEVVAAPAPSSPVVAASAPSSPAPAPALSSASEEASTVIESGSSARYPPSSRIDERFKVVRHLSSRDGRTLLLAVDEVGRRSTLQLVPSELVSHEPSRMALERAAKAVARLRNDVILEMKNLALTNDGKAYVELAELDGRTLADALDRGGFSIERGCGLIIALARALSRAHAEGLIHGDLRASNVLIEEKSGALEPRLFGFGLDEAERRAQEAPELKVSFARAPGYFAPERVTDPTQSHALSDQYALGALAFEILAGATPFADDAWAKQLLAHARTPAPDLRSLVPEVPEGVAAVVARALDKDPSRRFASCAELADKLAAAWVTPALSLSKGPAVPIPGPAVASEAPTVAPEAPAKGSARAPSLPKPEIRRRTTPFPFAAAGAGVFGLIVAYAVLRPHQPPPELEPEREPAEPLGAIHVESDPAGATILVDGKPTELKTPAAVPGVEVGQPVVVTVELDGYVSRPESATLRISEFIPDATARFALLPARVFRIESEPRGARVTLDGERVQGVTPLDLPPLVIGTSAVVEVTLEEFEPGRIELSASRDAPSTRRVVLEPLVELTVLSSPSRAEVRLDGNLIGYTPLKSYRAPKNRAFELSLIRQGYETSKRSVVVAKLPDPELRFELVPLGTTFDRPAVLAEIAALERRLSKAQGAVAHARGRLAQAEAKLEKLERDPSVHVSIRAQAQNVCDDRERELSEAEETAARVADDLDELKGTAGL